MFLYFVHGEARCRSPRSLFMFVLENYSNEKIPSGSPHLAPAGAKGMGKLKKHST
jgi:hypothetical protein